MTSHWMLALLATLLAGGAASAWLWTVRRRRDEAEAGIRALAAMRWREFSHFVLDAMRHRGYDVDTGAEELERGQQTDFILRREGKRWLLSCKHGSAYRIGEQAVTDLVNAIRFNGAAGGLLVTTGQVEADARSAAAHSRVELLAGEPLWKELAPLLPETLREEPRLSAERGARRQIAIAWLGALALGAVIALFAGVLAPETGPAETASPAPSATVPRPAAATAAPVEATEPEITDPQREERDRSTVAQVISDLPGIDRALWSTRSTLLVYLQPEAPDRLTEICAVLERYDALAASRLQLQPPPQSGRPVRFRQCRAF